MDILVWPAFSVTGIEIAEQLQYTKHINLFGASSSTEHPMSALYREVFALPDVRSADNKTVNKFLKNFIIFPAHDFVLDYIAENAEENLQWIGSSAQSIDVTRSKKKTYKYLTSHGLTKYVPHVYNENDLDLKFPIYAKPDSGYGSQGHYVLKNKGDVFALSSQSHEYVFSELLNGDEYTIECFTDSHGKLTYSSARKRERIRMGTSLSFQKPSREVGRILESIAEDINRELAINGPWYFQVKSKDAEGYKFKIMEIATRLPGSAVWSRSQGVNLAEMGIWNFLGHTVSSDKNEHGCILERELSSKLKLVEGYMHIYIDLDDTILRREKLDHWAIAFLVQERNLGKKIHLITKSLSKDLSGTLRVNHLEGMFDTITHIKVEDDKSKYILNQNSIFIDDSYSERLAVKAKHQIPCFGPDVFRIMVV